MAGRRAWASKGNWAGMVFGLLFPVAALAQDGQVEVTDGGDTAWLLAASALVLLGAVPGMALFHAGRARSGNTISVLFQGLAIMAAVSLAWAAVGYTLAFGDANNGWIGGGNAWMLIELGNVRDGTAVPESAFALYQIAVAILAAVTMTGAWAGRARFGWILAFTALWSLVVYAPVAHWLWGGGWLAQGLGAEDWCGGLVVQTTSGISALVVAVMLGARRGPPRGASQAWGPAIAILGAALVWLGWFGLAGGGAYGAGDDAGAAMIAAHLAAASAGLTWLLLERLGRGRGTVTGFACGAVAGLASIGAGAGFVSPGAAMLTGALGALACYFALGLVRGWLRIDDRLGVFALQGVGGIVGALLAAVFMSPSLGGVGYAEGKTLAGQVTAQLVGLGVIAVWSIVATVIVALMASVVFPMRVSEDAELEGLDSTVHGQ